MVRGLLHIAAHSDSLPADIVHATCFRIQIYGREQVQALLREVGTGGASVSSVNFLAICVAYYPRLSGRDTSQVGGFHESDSG